VAETTFTLVTALEKYKWFHRQHID